MPKPSRIPNCRKRGGQWVYRALVNKEEVTEYLGSDTEEARKQAEILNAKHTLSRLTEPSRPAIGTVAALIGEWLTRYVPEHRVKGDHKMIKARMRDHVLPVIGNLSLRQVRKTHLTALKDTLRAKGLATNTARHILSDCRCAFNWGMDEEIIESSPFAGKRILPPKPERVAPAYLTDEELTKILDAAPEPYKSAIDLARRTGLRWSEQKNLMWRHVDLDSAEPALLVERSKGGRPRRVPLDAETQEILKRWRKETASVYVMPWRPQQGEWACMVTRQACGFKWNWHRLRHTFATSYLRDGGSMEALSKLLGHSELRTTELYGQIEDRLVRADFARVRGNRLDTRLDKAAS